MKHMTFADAEYAGKRNSPGMYFSVPVTPMTVWRTLNLPVLRLMQSSR